MAPSVILLRVDVLAELGHVEGVVPIDHILPVVVALLVVGAQSRVAILLNVVVVGGVVAADHFLDPVTVFEFEVVEIDQVFDHALAAVILRHQLDQLVHYALEVGICLVPDLAVAPEVHKQLHSLSLRKACLADKCDEEESPRQIFELPIVQVDVESVLLGPVRQGQHVGETLQDVADVADLGQQHVDVPVVLVLEIDARLLEPINAGGEAVEGQEADACRHYF